MASVSQLVIKSAQGICNNRSGTSGKENKNKNFNTGFHSGGSFFWPTGPIHYFNSCASLL